MDFIVKLPVSHGYDSIWVVCNHLTHTAHFVPCNETISAPDLAWLFLDRIFHLHGLPSSIVSDHGSVFVSNFWQALTSTPYHLQVDGLTEHTNQTLETYLHAYCSYQQDGWVDYLPLMEFTFNNLENASTHQTPFFANLTFYPTFEPQIMECSMVPAAENLTQWLIQIHEELCTELEFAQKSQAWYYDQHCLPAPEFKKDQLIWLLHHNIKTT